MNIMDMIMKINRIIKTSPKLGKFWCHSCDRALIGKGNKCPICGIKDKSKHKK